LSRVLQGAAQHGITVLALKTEPEAAGSLVALADRIELWPIERLRPYERNPRTHSEAQVDQIAASMVEFGWTNPILVDENAGILAGHGRLLAARKLGLPEVPVIRFEHLSEAQKRAYILTDNQIALQAGWSEELLAEELAWLRDESFDLDLVGFDATELERLLAIADGETTSDEPSEPVVVSQPIRVKAVDQPGKHMRRLNVAAIFPQQLLQCGRLEERRRLARHRPTPHVLLIRSQVLRRLRPAVDRASNDR
jgi:ParB-like nuclease domain